MEVQFAQRMDLFQAGIFNVPDDKRKEMERAGRKVYNLSIGTPDFQPDRHVMEALSQAALLPENYKYSLTERSELVEAVQGWYAAATAWSWSDEIMSVYGSQEGLTHIGLAVCDPGMWCWCPTPAIPF